MTTRTLAAIALTTALGTLGFAQIGTPPAPMMAMMGGAGQPPMTGTGAMPGVAGMQMMHSMTDRTFLTMMIPHHQSAIQMSRAILKTTRDPQINTWATQIIADQQREITQMQGLLKEYGGPETGMTPGMLDMAGMMPAGPRSANPDVAYVQAMIPHHGMAVMMATHLLMQSTRPVMQNLARNIIAAQTNEIHAFQQYLNKVR